MGLFGKKEAEPVKTAKAQEPELREVTETVRVNLTDKMLKVELADEDAYVKNGIVELKDDRIRIVSGGRIIIAEVSQKSKTFKELEAYVGRSAEGIEIAAREGEYGPYYQVKLKFKHMAAG